MGNKLTTDHVNRSVSPFDVMWQSKRESAMSMKYTKGQASDFYFFCRNGQIDEVANVLNADESPSINELNQLQPNGSTALHAAVHFEHKHIVKLLLDHNCPRTTLNRFGLTAYEEAQDPEIKKLFDRPSTAHRFHESDASHTITVYLPTDDQEDSASDKKLEFVQVFKSNPEILEYSLNTQTIGMWIRFYNWFSSTFRVFIERDDFHIDALDLQKHADFQQFLKQNLSDPARYQKAIQAIQEASEHHSIEPLITLYSSESAGFYRSLNSQMAQATENAAMSPHLCDRYLIEFFIHQNELCKRAFKGVVYRGVTLPISALAVYEQAQACHPPGVIAFKTFTSASKDLDVALQFIGSTIPTCDQKNVLFIIEIPEVTSTIFAIEDLSEFVQEREVLILPTNLFIVSGIEEDQTLQIIKIYLRHWHVSVSLWQKIKRTIDSGKKSVL